ncbi:Ger(x)C family spore germination protein [Bacillus timonensis]|nr:Ger(x)C family spore germination protein [Bacillus timonensis]
MKRILLLAIFLPTILLLSGCWDQTDITKFHIVTGVGIDFDSDSNYELTVQTLIPSKTKEKNHQQQTFTAKGLTIYDAIDKLTTNSPKPLSYKQLQMLVVSKDVAEQGLNEVVDYFRREPTTRIKMKMFVSQSEPKELLSYKFNDSSATVKDISQSLRRKSEYGYVHDITFYQYIDKLLSHTTHPILPIIKLENDSIETEGTALFKNGKMVGSLTGEETKAFQRLAEGLIEASYTFSYLNKHHNMRDYVTVSVQDSKVKIEFDPTPLPTARILISEKALLREVRNSIPLNDENIAVIEKSYANQIIYDTNLLLAKFQLLGLDLVNFSSTVAKSDAKTYREQLENWDEYFRQVQFEVLTKPKLVENGMIRSLK